MASVAYFCSFVLLYLLELAGAKECRYIYENGDLKYFHCNIYEYCCGTMCCRSPAITFYQMWYFWLMVFLTVLFCSGGGWWYRLRNQGPFMSPALASYHSQPMASANYGPARSQVYPQTMPATAAPQSAQQPPPPPPYYGPPPSYDTVVNQARQG